MLSRRLRIALSILVVASLTFIILDLRGGEGPLSSARSALASMMGGVQTGAAVLLSPVTAFNSWWETLTSQSEQIRDLTADNENLQLQLRIAENERARVEELNALLNVSAVGSYAIVPAEVIAVGPAQDFSWTVTVDAGRADGIEPEMTVINGQGLVGRVLKVFATTSTVVLIVDASSAVGGRVATKEEIGIVSGTGRQDSLEFQLLDPLAEVREGDALVTFGSRGGRPYAPGLPIGKVTDVSGTAGQLTRVATVRPFAKMSTLSIVGVVVEPPRDDPRDALIADRRDVGQVAPTPAFSPEQAPSAEVEQPATPAPEAVLE
jgi:rod shape-determining protein MreC